jgi:hypothetical protein
MHLFVIKTIAIRVVIALRITIMSMLSHAIQKDYSA